MIVTKYAAGFRRRDDSGEERIFVRSKRTEKYFKVGKGTLKAVDDVSFYIRPGETLGVVGESGCGKTTCGRTVLGLYDRTDGEVLYRGKDVHKLKGEERKQFTKHAQIISRIRMRPWTRR